VEASSDIARRHAVKLMEDAGLIESDRIFGAYGVRRRTTRECTALTCVFD
jgi:hypothetical protein